MSRRFVNKVLMGPARTNLPLVAVYNKVIFGPVSPFVTPLCSRNNRKIKKKGKEQAKKSFVSLLDRRNFSYRSRREKEILQRKYIDTLLPDLLLDHRTQSIGRELGRSLIDLGWINLDHRELLRT